MDIYHPSLILLLGFIIDLIIGDPCYSLHLVRLMGHCINILLKMLKSAPFKKWLSGVILTTTVIFLSLLIYSSLYVLLNKIHVLAGLILNVYFLYSLIAIKDLFKHCRPVIKALENNDLKRARESIGMIVGRDVNYLDEKGIVRAAIETLAENFVDGFLSPVFWFSVGCFAGVAVNIAPVYIGIVFLIIFKTASTLDSMVGYKTDEFRVIGWSGARLDDVMNFIPARFSLAILFFAALLTGLYPFSGLKTAFRDRLKHESPNSAHSESFVAGAIRARLGGPARYSSGIKEKPWLGEEYNDPELSDIRCVINLLLYSAWLSVLFLSGLLYLAL